MARTSGSLPSPASCTSVLWVRIRIIYKRAVTFRANVDDVVMGIMLIYANSELAINTWSGLAYLSISFSLNILLTLMIIFRLILHARNTRAALGISGIGGLSKTIITMLIESCALYAVSTLLVLGPLGADDHRSPIMTFFLHILSQTQVRAFLRPRYLKAGGLMRRWIGQVIAPLLIIQRVANKSALTSNTIASRHLSSFRARSRGMSTGGNVNLSGGDPTSPVNNLGVGSGDLGVGDETTTDYHLDKI